MKKLLFFLSIFVQGIFSQQNIISVDFGAQKLSFSSQPGKIDPAMLPFVVSNQKNGGSFGIMFKGVKGTAPVLELFDANSKVIKTITVNDLLGKTSANGIKLISSSYSQSGNKSKDVYEISSVQGKFSLIVSSTATAAVSEKANPAKLFVKISLRNFKGTVTSASISLPVDGNAETSANGVVFSGVKTANAFSMTVSPAPSKTSLNKRMVMMTVSPSNGNDEIVIALLTFRGAENKNEAAAQVKNSAESGNDISIVTSASKIAAQPADTIEYEIVCLNSGKGPVSNVTISNPVPQGTRYLDGSAEGEDTQISFERSSAAPPQEGEVKSIQWKLAKPLSAGEEKIVRYKIVVQ